MSADVFVQGVLRERWDDATRLYTLYDETGVEVSVRPYTEDEDEAADAAVILVAEQINKATIESQASAALADNTTYIGLTTPTNAQVAAQVKALTRQNNKIIRLLLGRLDGTE